MLRREKLTKVHRLSPAQFSHGQVTVACGNNVSRINHRPVLTLADFVNGQGEGLEGRQAAKRRAMTPAPVDACELMPERSS